MASWVLESAVSCKFSSVRRRNFAARRKAGMPFGVNSAVTIGVLTL